MRRRLGFLAVIVLLSILLPVPVSAAGQTRMLSTNDLVENSYTWDGKTVSFRGEVLQDLMERKDGIWMNLSDGNNTAMGVFVPKEVAMPAISHLEDYRTIGDTVLVTGIFHRACALHEGETDIHAVSVEIIQTGASRDNPIHLDRVIWLLVILGLLAFVMRLYYGTSVRKAGS
jgi:hypothetical protein